MKQLLIILMFLLIFLLSLWPSSVSFSEEWSAPFGGENHRDSVDCHHLYHLAFVYEVPLFGVILIILQDITLLTEPLRKTLLLTSLFHPPTIPA